MGAEQIIVLNHGRIVGKGTHEQLIKNCPEYLAVSYTHLESVCAGALGVQLAGDAFYFGQLVHKPTIGDPGRPVTAEAVSYTHLKR